MAKKEERRILILDIETLPDLPKILKHLPRVDDWPSNSMKATINSVLCIGFKWLGESRTHILNNWDYSGWKRSVNDDKELLKAFAKIFNEADAIVTQNGKRFDLKFLQTRYVINELPPLDHKVLHLDTKQIAKRYLFAMGNRLNDLAEITGSNLKMENGGWELWEKCWRKEPKALAMMAKYCKQDVKTLEEVFIKLRPFVTQLPNANMWSLEKTNCPTCGSLNIQKHGMRVTKEGIKQRYRCNECGSVSQESKKGPTT